MYLAFEIALAVLVAVAIFLMTRGHGPREEHWPFVPGQVMSGPEQVLFRRLIEALPEFYVLAHVPLAKVLDIGEGANEQEWKALIAQKSVDFAICRQDSTIVAAVELTRQADETRDKALMDAGVKILRWRAEALPDVEAIKAALAG